MKFLRLNNSKSYVFNLIKFKIIDNIFYNINNNNDKNNFYKSKF